ncbi:MAG: sigma-70 family RNA polymerase sigma factor [Verrucomicrobiales bacterium]|nr:sigma-70 family RNA polymerase sigma factor [Verrucomicrobiales bacterium]
MTDAELLCRYRDQGCEGSFAELVRRHYPLILGTAARHLRDSHAAQDVAQGVLCALTRSAASIRHPSQLASWLHRTTRHLAMSHQRSEVRRRQRESNCAIPVADEPSPDLWQQIEPVFDQAIGQLRQEDRFAILLRFLEQRPIPDVAAELGVSEPAAKMRLSRAVDRLRSALVRHGVTCSVTALLVAIDRPAAQAAALDLEAMARIALDSPGVGLPVSSLSQSGWHEGLFSALSGVRLWVWSLVGVVTLVVSVWSLSGRGREIIAPTANPPLQRAGTSAESPTSHAMEHATREISSVMATGSNGFGGMKVTVRDAENDRPLAGMEIGVALSGLALGRFSTDASGVARVPRPTEMPGDFYYRLEVRGEGYPAAIASWSRFQQNEPSDIPSEHEIRLFPGRRIGGFLVDERGQPVGNTRIILWAGAESSGPPPTDRYLLMDGGREEVVTDAEGRWSLDRLPPEWERTWMLVSSLQYRRTQFVVDAPTGRPAAGDTVIGRGDLLEGRAVLRLSPGLRVSGSVRDASGQPISGARLVQQFRWDEAGARAESGRGGAFAILNAPMGTLDLSVQAEGYSPTTVRREIEGVVNDWQITLVPGSTLKGRVLDQEDRPLEGVEVEATSEDPVRPMFQWRMRTDTTGEFRWEGAPDRPFNVFAARFGYHHQTLSVDPRQGDQVIRLQRWDRYEVWPVEITAVDAASGASIDAFEGRLALDRGGFGPVKRGEGGRWICRVPKAAKTAVLQIRADGYSPVNLEWSQTTGPTNATVRLEAHLGWSGRVLLPDGKPAAGAEVALASPMQTAILGDRQLLFHEETPYCRTDDEGRFTLPAPPHQMMRGRALFAVHAAGFAELDADRTESPVELVLQPWGRVEGQFRSKEGAVGDVEILLMRRLWNLQTVGLQLYAEPFVAKTDSSGRFVFTNVPPGAVSLDLFVLNQSIGKRATAVVRSGEVTAVDLGGEGRTVVGKVRWLEAPTNAMLAQASLSLRLRVADLPERLSGPRRGDFGSDAAYVAASETYGRQMDDLWQSKRGLAAWLKERVYTGIVSEEGQFRFDDVVPGEYEVEVWQRTMRSLVPGEAPSRLSPAGPRLRGTLRVSPADPASGDIRVNLESVELRADR